MDTNRIVQFVRDPSLQHIELRYSRYNQPVFHRHNHDAYSIGLVKKGSTRFHLVQHVEEIIPVVQGDLVLINPGEVHACNPEGGSMFSYYMLYIDADYFLGLVADFSGTAVDNYRFPLPVLKNTAIRRQFDCLCRSMMTGGTRLEIESQFHETLGAILNNCGSRQNISPVATAASIQTGYEFLQTHLAENISLQELASLCNLSPYHFLRLFHRQYGLPPHTCQLQMRINQSRRLLAKGMTIADTAAAVGFSDQSHFTRKFRLSVGATPSQYQSGLPLKTDH